MTKLEHLEHLAHQKDIHIHDYCFSKTKKAACHYMVDGSWEYKAILLDRPNIKSSVEETILLAEELGHYETEALYFVEATTNTPSARSTRMKCEARAKRWAVRHLLPSGEIQKVIDGGRYLVCEIAEELSVTEDFLSLAINYYISKGELSLTLSKT